MFACKVSHFGIAIFSLLHHAEYRGNSEHKNNLQVIKQLAQISYLVATKILFWSMLFLNKSQQRRIPKRNSGETTA